MRLVQIRFMHINSQEITISRSNKVVSIRCNRVVSIRCTRVVLIRCVRVVLIRCVRVVLIRCIRVVLIRCIRVVLIHCVQILRKATINAWYLLLSLLLRGSWGQLTPTCFPIIERNGCHNPEVGKSISCAIII